MEKEKKMKKQHKSIIWTAYM